ncbi:arylamine N-acetyltransferase, pineal gland isozyme NAT-3-like [Lethenteron reissneri]|uniref:arylamine N-acetyltransferase, pineal gland isozyme NAT-3-like n=1 Tax=Lethenteron reissneri TaxID=7753 RepID=UPI002AB73DED|nr:arylamine N-acetyltransferase, pineal gland isozyme NAT-3-like [Lethenteron reissneri]XP_061412129.1 arylamine N-acetyltransferase, pineal gland isozyme NAT-3-like [Lethenteron reissneri]
MDVGAYLERICFVGSTAPSVASLRALHRAHVLSVPFETLSIHCGEPITLDLEKIYRKIVKERRGGFCYENNGLFSWLLRQLGFQVTLCSARMLSPFTHRYGPPFQHLMILVKLGATDGQKCPSALPSGERQLERFVVDVGFGNGMREPLEMESGRESEQESGTYRLRSDCPAGWWSLEEASVEEASVEEAGGDGIQLKDVELQPPRAGEDECWTVLYKFTTTARGFLEFSDMCQYNQTSPSSMPASKSLCTLHTPQGRVTYMGRRLTSTTVKPARNHRVRRKSKAVRELSDEEIPIVLRDVFGVVLKNPLVPKDRAIVPEECDQF